MKHLWKKITCVLLAMIFVFSMTACSSSEDESINADMQTALISTAEGLSQTVIALSDEEIESYMETGDDFTRDVMEVWDGSREELGELVEWKEATVERDGIEYVVTLPATFTGADANFVYMFDRTGNPTSLSVEVEYPMSVSLQRAALNTVMGLGTVFVVLIFLSFIIWLFKFIPNPETKEREAAKAAKPAPAPAPAPAAAPAPVQTPAASASGTDDKELVAVIAAAIAAAEGTSPDGFVVRSIRKVNRRKW